MPGVARTSTPSGVDAVLGLRQSPHGASASFLVQASDGRDYWCKAVNNPTSPRIPINEQIAARFGRLIGAAVCETELVRLDGIVGYEFRAGLVVQAGWAHGALAIDPALETRQLEHRGDDDNQRRHASFYALTEWLHGGDSQWLYAIADSNAYYSHDHGHYFPSGPDWTSASLQHSRDARATLGFSSAGLDAQEIERLATNIEQITCDELVAELSQLPADWPVTDGELDAMIDFVAHRRSLAAAGLRALQP